MVPQNRTKHPWREKTMSRKSLYSPEFKSKIVLELLQGEKELNQIAADNNLNPNMIRTWRKEFLANASRVFSESRIEKESRRKEEALEKQRTQMLKTIGQLTLERDFLQDCFRKTGKPIPVLNQQGQ